VIRSPDDVVVAGFPERSAVAFRDLLENVGDELGVGRELGHDGVPSIDGFDFDKAEGHAGITRQSSNTVTPAQEPR
jgi:hypothetical protein